MIEAKHIIIGLFLFFLLAGAAAGKENDIDLTKGEKIVALTILGEARGEGRSGMYAVACVIEKRIQESTVKHTAAEVCLQSWQFSVWNAGKGKVKKESQLHYLWESKSKDYAILLARIVCDKDKDLQHSYVRNANHYYAMDLKPPPSWTVDPKTKLLIRPVSKHGKHLFYKVPWASNRK